MKRIAWIVLGWLVLQATAHAANIIQIAADEHDIPFLLDNDGHVWGFRDPWTFSGGPDEPPAPPNLRRLVKLPNLEHIKKIAPYIAIDKEGQAFTWTIDKAEFFEGYVVDASYTKPKRVGDLKGITSIAYSVGHFAAVINNQDVVEWAAVKPYKTGSYGEVIGFDNYGPVKKLFSQKGIKDISTTNLIAEAGKFNLSYGLEVLFDDGTLMGWGVTPTGQVSKTSSYQSVSLGKFSEPLGLSMNISHTIILSANGIPSFLGECDVVKKYADGHLAQQVGIHTADGNLADVIKIGTVINHNDDYNPDAFIKRDGSVWFEFAPIPTSLPGYSKCSPFDPSMYYRNAEQVYAGKAAAVQIVKGNFVYFMLDADHNLWSIGVNEFRYKKKSFRSVPVDLK
jgi:hypothetical protein